MCHTPVCYRKITTLFPLDRYLFLSSIFQSTLFAHWHISRIHIYTAFIALTTPTSEWWARFTADVNQHTPINIFGKSHWPDLDGVVSGWWVCTSVFDSFMTIFWMFCFFQLFYTFKFFSGFVKLYLYWEKLGQREVKPLCNAGNLGDSSPRDTHFLSSKPSSSPDSKAAQIQPPRPGVLHQNSTILTAKEGPQLWPRLDLSFHGTPQQSLSLLPLLKVLHSLLQQWTKHRGVPLWSHGSPGRS